MNTTSTFRIASTAILIVLLGGTNPARSMTIPEVITELQRLQGELGHELLTAMEAVADVDKASQLAHTQTAIEKVTAEIAVLKDPANGVNLQDRKIHAYLENRKSVLAALERAKALLEKDVKTQAARIKALKREQVLDAKGQKKLNAWRVSEGQSFVSIEEVRPGRAGFVGAGGNVCYRVKTYGDPSAVPTPVTVAVTNPASSLGYIAVQQPAAPIVIDPLNGTTEFCLTTGSTMGGANLVLSAGGEKAGARLLFNTGVKQKVTATQGPFDGNYAGTYTGTAVYTTPDGHTHFDPLAGNVAAWIYRTTIKVTNPPGKGHVAANGASDFTAGGGSVTVGSNPVNFMGSFQKARNGTVKGSGVWRSRYVEQGVTVKESGNWSVNGP